MRTQQTALEAAPLLDSDIRRMRMRALHRRHRSRCGLRRQIREGLHLSWYLVRLTVHALGFGALLAGMLAILYCIG